MSDNLDNLRVVLIGVRNPLNIGAAARAMSNFGARQLRLVNPYEVAFREARSAVGAAQVLAEAEEFKNVADAVADCTLVVGTTAGGRRELQHPLRYLEDGARLIRKRLRAGPVALLFGSEKTGLSNRDMAHCHWLIRIPTREKHPSMNLAQAVAVCMYELVRQTKAPQPLEKKTPAKARDVEAITITLLDALNRSGYVKPRVADITEEKLRRLVRRLQLEAHDAELLLGMLRQIVWKLSTQESSTNVHED
jgi:tRNA/rRNA methyltransferase